MPRRRWRKSRAKSLCRRCLERTARAYKAGRKAQPGVDYQFVPDVKKLAEASDFLIVACPGGEATRNLVNAEVLAALGKKGTIVNIASRLGQMGVTETAAYSAAKAGLIGLTRSLAREFGTTGVRINAVAPGVTLTEMTTDLIDTEAGKARLRDMALGRFGRADEVAEAVIFLLSDKASLFTGQTLNPNSGGYMP